MKNVLIVGTGLIARFHAQAVKASSRLHLVGFCGRARARAQVLADEFGGCAWDDLSVALRDSRVEMAVVATASGAHDEAVLAAAQARVPVLVEKPITLTIARAERMIAACRATDTPLGCIFQTRWSADFQNARKRVASGELGRLTYAGIRIPWWRNDSYYTSSSWHGTWAMDGGGALMNQAIHMVDWLVALMPPVEEVKAFTATLAHPIEAEDTVSAAFRFKGGALGGLYATTASFPGRGKTLEITGTKGTLELSDSAHGAARPDQLAYADHQACFESFAASLEGGDPYPIPGEEALKSLNLIRRVYASAECGGL